MARTEQDRQVVDTSAGRLRGVVEDGVVVFRGVPYARPPVGPLRFRAPQPVEPWTGVRDAGASGPASYQVVHDNQARVEALERELDPGVQGPPVYLGAGLKAYMPPAVSEDCLYLNIWVPAGVQASDLPVFLYFHGGANMVNAGSFELERGELLAREEKVIVVRPNYRLGALGWVHFGLLSEELSEAINLGLQDQIAALHWVSQNIEAFGGDKENITVAGESAGATAVSHLLVNATARPLFRRAILQSLSPFNTWCTQPPEQAAEVAQLYLDILEVDSPAELISIDADRLLAVAALLGRYFHPDKNVAWRPLGGVVDGDWIPDLPATELASRGLAGPPCEVMLGFAKDEWLLFRITGETVRNGTDEDVLKVLSQVFEERAAAVLGAYRELNPTHSPGRLLSDIMSFEFFKYPTLAIARTLAAQNVAAYVFEFAYEMPAFGGALHAVHTGDMPFIWRTCAGVDLERWPSLENADAEEVASVAQEFGRFYGAFIRDGNPGPRWERFADTQSILWFGTRMQSREALLAEEQRIFEQTGEVGSLDELQARLTANAMDELAASRRDTDPPSRQGT